jgi:hypothetical protein
MVAQRPGKKVKLTGAELGIHVEIAEEVYRSKIGQRLAYPG